MRDFPEADWKVFRDVHLLALERFCRRVLTEAGKLTVEDGSSSHERYGTLYGLIQRRDKELALMFNDARRSTALLQLVHLRREGLLTEAEFADFSSETRSRVDAFLKL
jgi:hypothetical protein